MIFPVVECERIVQVGDKTRISGCKSFVSKGDSQIDKVEICPQFTDGSEVVDFSTPFITANFQAESTLIATGNTDLSQVQPGMLVQSSAFDLSLTVHVVSVDIPNNSITTDIAPNMTGAFDGTISGQITVATEPVFVDVSGRDERDWFLDYVYSATQSQDILTAVRVTSAGTSQTAMKTLRVLAIADDVLFSTDDDLIALEPGLTRFVPDGRSSFINVHREARNKILEALSDEGIRNQDGTPLTTMVLKNLSEVRTWSRDLTLSLIFQGMSNEAGDVFQAKAKFYDQAAAQRGDRAFLTLSVPVNGRDDQPYRAGQVQTMSLCR